MISAASEVQSGILLHACGDIKFMKRGITAPRHAGWEESWNVGSCESASKIENSRRRIPPRLNTAELSTMLLVDILANHCEGTNRLQRDHHKAKLRGFSKTGDSAALRESWRSRSTLRSLRRKNPFFFLAHCIG